MRNGNNQPVPLRRFYAVLALRGLTLTSLGERCGVSSVHLRNVFLGERKPSERLVEALKQELGLDGWAFIKGQVDTLAAPGVPATRGIA